MGEFSGEVKVSHAVEWSSIDEDGGGDEPSDVSMS